MMRDDLLLEWFDRNTGAEVSWLDIGAGDGSVSRALQKVRPLGWYSCWDVDPKHPKVMSMRTWDIPPIAVQYILFNFVLHHVGDEAAVDKYIRDAFYHSSRGVLIQEDIDDHKVSTQKKLREHEPKGFFLSIERWQEKFQQLCPEAIVSTFPHPEPSQNTLGYHVPRAFFILNKPAEI